MIHEVQYPACTPIIFAGYERRGFAGTVAGTVVSQGIAAASAGTRTGSCCGTRSSSEGTTAIGSGSVSLSQRLEALTKEAVRQLVRPIVGEEVTLEVTVADGRVRVAVDCEEDSGLLIGREGQTLASLQYLASRVVSRGMNAAVRVQLDAGRYRQRQDEKLREMALALAEKQAEEGSR